MGPLLCVGAIWVPYSFISMVIRHLLYNPHTDLMASSLEWDLPQLAQLL